MVLVNGRLPEAMTPMTTGGRPLYTLAALAFERTTVAFRQRFGKPLLFGAGWTGYRTRQQQEILYANLGYPAAAYPGTSNHGLGLAGDFNAGVQTYGSPEWQWMNTVGRTYGWSPLNENNLRFEPWHWVYNVSDDQHYGQPPGYTPTPPTPEPEPVPDLIAQLEDDMRLARKKSTGEVVLVGVATLFELTFAEYVTMRGVIGKDYVDLSDDEWNLLYATIGKSIENTGQNLRLPGF